MNRRVRTIDENLGLARSNISRWIIPALLLSLLLHGLFWFWAKNVSISHFSGVSHKDVVPHAFHVERLKVEPELLEPLPEKQTAASPVAMKLPDEKVSFEKMMDDARPTSMAPQLDKALLNEKPSLDTPSFQSTIKTAQGADANSLPPDAKTISQELLNTKPAVTEKSILELPAPQHVGGTDIARAGGRRGNTPAGFSDLDTLLAQTGPLTPETAPILMPGDLLYDYNAIELRPEAVESLKKLGILIRRNPSIQFIIQGHTDSFGPDDYNLELSRKRAESVKAWLTETMGLPAASIQTKGFGKTQLIAPAAGTIEEQQINRRVEIVIRALDDVSSP